MTSNILSPAALCLLLSFAYLQYNQTASADQRVLTDDGREVMLMGDGSWKFLSNDRFASTGDGRRVRLKAGGRWEYIGNAPLVSDQQVRTLELDLKLQKAVIETHEVKVQKNKRVNSQTVFYFTLVLSTLAKSEISLHENDISLIKVNDNQGRNYPALSIQPGLVSLKPGASTSVAVRVDGSPQWWKNVKTMQVEFSPGIFGITEPIVLSRHVDDFLKKNVDGFGNE